MDLKIRKIIARVKPIHKLCRMLMYDSGVFYYKKIYNSNNYEQKFNELKGSQAGKRCFIIGNGPSLKPSDLDRITDEDCFGTNEIHRIFNQTRWRPRYYVVIDRYSKSTPEQIRDLKCEMVFLSDYYCRFNPVLRKDFICLHQHYNWNEKRYLFSSDISKAIVSSPTVSYAAMQIAAYLGYKEIYLLGFDHNYSFEFAPDGSIIKTDKRDTHFFKDDVPEDIIADVLGMTRSYESFKRYADNNGIVVRNATRGGKLEIFDRVDFDSLFH